MARNDEEGGRYENNYPNLERMLAYGKVNFFLI
jgi:hypothetical protein